MCRVNIYFYYGYTTLLILNTRLVTVTHIVCEDRVSFGSLLTQRIIMLVRSVTRKILWLKEGNLAENNWFLDYSNKYGYYGYVV